MKRGAVWFLAAGLLAGVAFHRAGAEGERVQPTEPERVLVSQESSSFEAGARFHLSFPDPMVAKESIGGVADRALIAVEPETPLEVIWRSETEATVTFRGPLKPGTTYRLGFAPGVKTAEGKEPSDPAWKHESRSDEFKVSAWVGEESLDRSGAVNVQTNYPVRYADAAAAIRYREVDSGATRPVEVLFAGDAETGERFTVQAREPLEPGKEWALVIDGLKDAATGTPLAAPVVDPIGETQWQKIRWVGAFNLPLRKPEIIVKFSEPLDPESVTPDAVRVEPEPSGMRLRAAGQELVIEGTFDRSKRHVVTLGTGLRSLSGFPLEKPERWGATFRPREQQILFPGESEFHVPTGRPFRFPLVQSRTPALTWRLAEIPIEKLPVARERVHEFREGATDPLSGEPILDDASGYKLQRKKRTELFVETLGLEVVASGTIPASPGDEEADRTVEWTPDRPMRGAYLFEVHCARDDGSVLGNRAVVYFGDKIVTEVADRHSYAVRVSRMETAEPAAGATVSALSPEGIVLGRAVADETGLARFADPFRLFDEKRRGGRFGNARLLLVEDASGRVIEPVDVASYSLSQKEEPIFRAAAVTDRNVYRPGQAVKIYGIVRETPDLAAPDIRQPKERRVRWMIGRDEDGEGEEVVSGEAKLSPMGGWEAEWTIPESLPLGLYRISVGSGDDGPVEHGTLGEFQVQEYRPPLFTNSVEAAPRLAGTESRVKLASRYFHGAPNAGATVRWRASWSAEDDKEWWEDGGLALHPEEFVRTDAATEGAKEVPGFAEQAGETALDASGAAELVCPMPFADGLQRGRCEVRWSIEIVSPDGQTLVESATQLVQVPEFYPAIQVSETEGETAEENLRLAVRWVAFGLDDKPVAGVRGTLEAYAVSTKTAKEQVAPFTFRYRNWPVYTKVAERAVESGPGLNELEIPVEKAGDYVVSLRTSPGGREWRVSESEALSGLGLSEFPVEDERRFDLEPDERRAFEPGEVARFTARAPFPGMAWVYVHTTKLLDVFPVRLETNAGRIEVPVKPEYAPNVGVTVHLMAPSAGGATPQERVGRATLAVARPDRRLAVAHELAKPEVEPGQNVEGLLRVTGAGGKPVPDAELAVFAVDEAILSLGQWEEPDLPRFFFPERWCNLSLGLGLGRYVEDFGKRESFEKGFVIGGGGLGMKGAAPKYARKEFKPLAYWKALARTDKAGEFRYSFPAPDNLTTYRIVAIAQDGGERFACGSAPVRVNKPLIVEPALPRFVREGDTFAIRAVARQSSGRPVPLRVTASAEGLELAGPAEVRLASESGAPAVATFLAKVPAGLASATVTVGVAVAAEDGSLSPDAAEIRLPVKPRSVLRRATVSGTATGGSADLSKIAPEAWRDGAGRADWIVSSSPWLPKLLGLPSMLEYPHGCFEQTATRYLACSFLAELLAYLPEEAERKRNYEAVLRKGLRDWGESISPRGFLPMWPGGSTPSPFVTAMAAWAADEAARAGWQIPPDLSVKLGNGLDAVARDKVPREAVPSDTRAFALMVLALRGEPGSSYEALADDLYLTRDRMSDEGRAFLAFAVSRFGILPDRLSRLLAEVGGPVKERAFDPATFGSTTRAEAVRTLAFVENEKGFWKTDRAKPMRDRLLALLDTSESLSTQENLWLLFAFRSLHREGKFGPVGAKGLAPKPDALSANGASAGWFGRDLAETVAAKLSGFSAKAERTILLRAEYRREEETRREARGLRLERVVTNLTDPARTGEPGKAFRLGDRILVTYRTQTAGLHHFVALEDLLPAGLETVNPDLPLLAKAFELPDAGDALLLNLSHKELRDDATRLYFDEIRPGSGTYSVLARATVAGEFVWPSAQITPMYDSRFGALSPSSVCRVEE